MTSEKQWAVAYRGSDGKTVVEWRSTKRAAALLLQNVRMEHADAHAYSGRPSEIAMSIASDFPVNTPKPQKMMVMMLDDIDAPRAWGISPSVDTARAIAKEQLDLYIKRKAEVGEWYKAEDFREKVVALDDRC